MDETGWESRFTLRIDTFYGSDEISVRLSEFEAYWKLGEMSTNDAGNCWEALKAEIAGIAQLNQSVATSAIFYISFHVAFYKGHINVIRKSSPHFLMSTTLCKRRFSFP